MYNSSTYEVLDLLGGSTSRSATSSIDGTAIWTIIALILAIVGGILVYFLFVKSKTDFKGKFVKWLRDFLAFKTMWIEPILKVTYYILTIFAVLNSFSFLTLGGIGFLLFLVSLIGMPILIRIGYEVSIMFVMIWRNTRDIAENTKKK